MVSWSRLFALVSLAWVLGCSGNPPAEPASDHRATPAQVVATAEPVTPPFAVQGELEGLLLVWYDAEGGAHTASSRGDIPPERREHVRVDSLEVAPDARLDPAFVYVADLRAPGADGSYGVRKVAREAFEATLEKPAAQVATTQANKDVIIYGASWCGACKQAAGYFHQKGVPFIEKDIEKEPAARSEMLAKAQAQGVRTSGIPVIDVYGTVLGGFDPERIEALLARK